jgi:hypothetical protein
MEGKSVPLRKFQFFSHETSTQCFFAGKASDYANKCVFLVVRRRRRNLHCKQNLAIWDPKICTSVWNIPLTLKQTLVKVIFNGVFRHPPGSSENVFVQDFVGHVVGSNARQEWNLCHRGPVKAPKRRLVLTLIRTATYVCGSILRSRFGRKVFGIF